jgi:CRP-like cAMP-binding protein
MRTEVAVVLLRRARLFAELDEETLAALADRSVERSFPRHARLFHKPLAAERGTETPDGIELDTNLTQTDLAGMVGASRQSVNQILQGFARRGYLQVRDRRIVVQRLDLLRRRAGLDPVSGG